MEANEPRIPGVTAPSVKTRPDNNNIGLPHPKYPLRDLIRKLTQNKKVVAGGTILVAMVFVVAFAPLIAPGDPMAFVAQANQPPSAEHLLGTSGQGQDVFVQLIRGSRVSLLTGVFVGLIATILGIIVGMTAGYFGGAVDNILSVVMNVFLVIPGLPLLVVLAAFLPRTPATIVLVLGLTGWPGTARVLRAQTLSVRTKEYVSAAIVGGESIFRVIFAEILPNMASIVASSLLGGIAFGIVAEAGLEFLGLGDTSRVSWGTILYWAQNNAGLLTGAWWTFLPPGLCIALAAFSLTLINYSVDEITNPALRSQRSGGAILRKLYLRSRATPVVPNEK